MPELPEVELVVRSLLERRLVGRSITGIQVGWERTVGGCGRAFADAVSGSRIGAVARRGKLIRIDLEREGALFVHLKMSGRLHLASKEVPASQYDRLVLTLDDGRELRLYDPRKFGRVLHAEDPEAVAGRIGVEPLSPKFDPRWLKREMHSRRRRLKPFLLDQTILAGLGNIYTDEALWRAKIHPLLPSNSLSDGRIEALHAAIVAVLTSGIENGGTALGRGKGNFRLEGAPAPRNQNYLQVFQKTGRPCPRCGTGIVRIVVGGRSTHVCPRCQIPPSVVFPQ